MAFESHGVEYCEYVIYVIVGLDCKYSDIDKFLRNTWFSSCENCNHLSKFEGYKKSDIVNSEIGPHNIVKYIFDYGSTTEVDLFMLAVLNGKEKNTNIDLVYQFERPKIKCYGCKKASEYLYEGECYCALCIKDIDDYEENEKYIIKLENNPRTGSCC